MSLAARLDRIEQAATRKMARTRYVTTDATGERLSALVDAYKAAGDLLPGDLVWVQPLGTDDPEFQIPGVSEQRRPTHAEALRMLADPHGDYLDATLAVQDAHPSAFPLVVR